jgi:site-specific DNA-cytosine methylase
MNVLSLFDGISCGRIALDRAGIKVDNYYASEIDEKIAIKISKKNYSDILHLGDITLWKTWDIDWASIDLVIGGSPCQGFSFCGKQLNFEDLRSKLFFIYAEIISHLKNINKNIKFMLENVNMKKEYQDIISERLGVKPHVIDSKLITPMRRKRLYWFNWAIDDLKPIETKLTDILDSDVSNTHFLKQEQFEKITYMENGVLYIKNQPNKKMKVNHGDGVSLSRTWQQYMPIIKQQSHCIRAGNPNDIGIAISFEGEIKFKKFTRSEMEKMQTIPVGYTHHADLSERQSKMSIGNAWTVDVVAYLLSFVNI